MYICIYVASSVEMLYGYWDCMCAHLDTLPGHVWGTHVALDICSNFWYVPWIIPCDRGMNNEMFYAILLLRQAYVTVLFECTDVQNYMHTLCII